MIKMYTKSSCPNCTQAKSLLNQKGIVFVEVSLDDPSLREDFVQSYPLIRQAPAIFSDGEYIGGYSALVEHLSANTTQLLEG